MNQKDKVFSDFVNNSEVFGNAETREKLLQILYTHFFESGYYTVDSLEKLGVEKKWEPYIKPLIHIARDENLRLLTEGNDLLSSKITVDLANWLEENYQKIKEKEELMDAKGDFYEFQSSYAKYSEQDWMELIEKLKKTYPEFMKYWDFYEEKMSVLYSKIEGGTDAENQQEIMDEISAVQKKLEEDYMRAVEEKEGKMAEEEMKNNAFLLKSDLRNHERQLSNFLETMGVVFGFMSGGLHGKNPSSSPMPSLEDNARFWSLSMGFWNITVNWDAIDQYAKILEKNEQIKELAELLGRLHESEEEYEMQLIEKTKITHEWRVDSAGKSEIKGIHFSDDLNSLLPSEVALLSMPETEVVFAKKFAEKKLLTFYYEDRYRAEKEIPEMIEEAKRKEEEKKGPIIACVDTSGSMSGVPETVAKTIILALLRIAMRDYRDCYLISFSTGIETLEISDMASNMPKLIRFMEMGFQGGTDATPALEEALNMLETEKYKKADVVMVSDFIMGSVPRPLKEKISLQKEKDTKFHSIVISHLANPSVTEIFDTEWKINYKNYNEMFFTVRTIGDKI